MSSSRWWSFWRKPEGSSARSSSATRRMREGKRSKAFTRAGAPAGRGPGSRVRRPGPSVDSDTGGCGHKREPGAGEWGRKGEGRGGEEGRSRGGADHLKKKK